MRNTDPASLPPTYDTKLPNPNTVGFPQDFRKLKKYIYPYVNNPSRIRPTHPISADPSPLSPAGGAPGGNPSLYEVFANITAIVTNTGDLDGACVAQLYVSLPQNYHSSRIPKWSSRSKGLEILNWLLACARPHCYCAV